MTTPALLALAALLRHVDAETCTHEETCRAGATWTICNLCGEKWADDRGGFKPHVDHPAVANARRALAAPSGGDESGVSVCARHGINFAKGCEYCEQDIDALANPPLQVEGDAADHVQRLVTLGDSLPKSAQWDDYRIALVAAVNALTTPPAVLTPVSGDGPIFVKLHRPAGYEDADPVLIIEDAGIHPDFRPEIVATPPAAVVPVLHMQPTWTKEMLADVDLRADGLYHRWNCGLQQAQVVDELTSVLRNLIVAGKRLRNSVVETRGVAGMDGHDAALRDAEAALSKGGG